ncbi:hypothetical protein FA15DRAFT_83089 [Coprinopsis marcescibilis]|uniref:Uncharacterized protein n=1 Tax=Coprinopsis marcescibilis TaxID=230819 RepID=A0A5C3KM01_COPMA|nr:hypothetical protein FA15DRAFT_83089 [Coprinopsis marcescibilis]
MSDAPGLTTSMNSPIKCNTSFYWEPIFFKVGDELFCVPRNEFTRSSEVFADMFTLPSVGIIEGQDREHPMLLEGYKKSDFEALLRILYPPHESIVSPAFTLEMDKEAWIGVLRLSSIWNMKTIRDYAIERLTKEVNALTPAAKIVLARTHKVKRWFDQGFQELISGKPPPLEELSESLGLTSAAQVLTIRDHNRYGPPCPVSGVLFCIDSVKCGYCKTNKPYLPDGRRCTSCHSHLGPDSMLYATVAGEETWYSPNDRKILYTDVRCGSCHKNPFTDLTFQCPNCHDVSEGGVDHTMRMTSVDGKQFQPTVKSMIDVYFGEEMKEYQLLE